MRDFKWLLASASMGLLLATSSFNALADVASRVQIVPTTAIGTSTIVLVVAGVCFIAPKNKCVVGKCNYWY